MKIYAIKSCGAFSSGPEAYLNSLDLVRPWIEKQWGSELKSLKLEGNQWISRIERKSTGYEFTQVYEVFEIKVLKEIKNDTK